MFSLTGSPFGLKNASNLRPLNLLQVIDILGDNNNDTFLIFFRDVFSAAYCIAPHRSLKPVDQTNHLLQILIAYLKHLEQEKKLLPERYQVKIIFLAQNYFPSS